MKVATWIVQSGLCAVLLGSGLVKILTPYEEIAATVAWAQLFSAPAVVALGVVQLAAAAGLILPALTGIGEFLTPAAAVGVVLYMIGAAVVHVLVDEPHMIVLPASVAAPAAFVAWARGRMLLRRNRSS